MNEADLNQAGIDSLSYEFKNQLINRLEIEEWTKRHPEILEQKIEAPIILATLPRTGQTAAGWILDRDKNNRALYNWLTKRPVPPPLPDAELEDPRLRELLLQKKKLPSELERMHLTDPREPDECHFLISNAFRFPHQIYSMQVPSFYEWSINQADMSEAYAYYRRQLQLIQSKTPGQRWVLKNSPHLLHLDELNAALPGARYVQFHRNPFAVIASNCHLTVVLRSMRSDNINKHDIGESILRLLSDYVTRTLSFRDRQVSEPWVDINFESFVSNPAHEIERIYDELGMTLSPDSYNNMKEWVTANPHDPKRPDLDLTEFGISTKQVGKIFSEYCDRFKVQM